MQYWKYWGMDYTIGLCKNSVEFLLKQPYH
nr:MAG TPA: hypothetical protein [Caudoviricetes sp.]